MLVSLIEQVASCDVLHNYVDVSFVFQKLEDTGNMRMVYLFKYLKLILHKILVHFMLIELILKDSLDSAWNTRYSMGTNFDNAKGTSTKLSTKLIQFTEL